MINHDINLSFGKSAQDQATAGCISRDHLILNNLMLLNFYMMRTGLYRQKLPLHTFMDLRRMWRSGLALGISL